MSDSRGLILDLDGTIYDWVDFFAPCFRAMVHVLARVTELDEDVITGSFRRVYQKYSSVEYYFSIQELDIWSTLKWSREKIEEKAVKPARGAFRRVRQKRLHLYPNVRDTLIWAQKERLLIIAYSDAPEFQAQARLKYLRIDRFFDLLLSWKGHGVPEHALSDVHTRMKEGTYRWRIPSTRYRGLADAKPNPDILTSVLREFQLLPENTYLVGDSLWKDIYAAQQVGMNDIWAEYGRVINERKNLDTILRITPWTEEMLAKNQAASDEIHPTYVIKDFAEVISIIGTTRPAQLTFF